MVVGAGGQFHFVARGCAAECRPDVLQLGIAQRATRDAQGPLAFQPSHLTQNLLDDLEMLALSGSRNITALDRFEALIFGSCDAVTLWLNHSLFD